MVRHTSVEVRTADVDREIYGPAVAVEFYSGTMVNATITPFREFLLNCLPLLND